MGTITLAELSKKKERIPNVQQIEKKSKVIKKKSLKSFEKSYKNQKSEIKEMLEVEDLKKELKKLKEENYLLRSEKPLTKNENKILNAIRSEAIEQKTNTPIISTSMLRKKHKVSAKYQGNSIRNLIDKSLIIREEVSFSGNVKTYSWQILKH